MFSFVNETQENIVDLFSNEGAQSQEFSIDAMKHSFKKVTFTRIFRVEKLQQLKQLRESIKSLTQIKKQSNSLEEQIFGQSLFSRWLPESLTIPGIVKTLRTLIEDEARTLQVLSTLR